MSIIARIVAVFALSLSLPKIMGIGPSIITPPAFILDSTFLTGVSLRMWPLGIRSIFKICFSSEWARSF